MRPLKKDKTKILTTIDSLTKVENITECSTCSILQYFWPAFSDNWFLKPILGVAILHRFLCIYNILLT